MIIRLCAKVNTRALWAIIYFQICQTLLLFEAVHQWPWDLRSWSKLECCYYILLMSKRMILIGRHKKLVLFFKCVTQTFLCNYSNYRYVLLFTFCCFWEQPAMSPLVSICKHWAVMVIPNLALAIASRYSTDSPCSTDFWLSHWQESLTLFAARVTRLSSAWTSLNAFW